MFIRTLHHTAQSNYLLILSLIEIGPKICILSQSRLNSLVKIWKHVERIYPSTASYGYCEVNYFCNELLCRVTSPFALWLFYNHVFLCSWQLMWHSMISSVPISIPPRSYRAIENRSNDWAWTHYAAGKGQRKLVTRVHLCLSVAVWRGHEHWALKNKIERSSHLTLFSLAKTRSASCACWSISVPEWLIIAIKSYWMQNLEMYFFYPSPLHYKQFLTTHSISR